MGLFSKLYYTETCVIEKIIIDDDDLEVQDSKHSRQRKTDRRNKYKRNKVQKNVTDNEIITDIRAAFTNIKQLYDDGKIVIGDRFVVYNSGTDLNIVIALNNVVNGKYELAIPTIDRKPNFKTHTEKITI